MSNIEYNKFARAIFNNAANDYQRNFTPKYLPGYLITSTEMEVIINSIMQFLEEYPLGYPISGLDIANYKEHNPGLSDDKIIMNLKCQLILYHVFYHAIGGAVDSRYIGVTIDEFIEGLIGLASLGIPTVVIKQLRAYIKVRINKALAQNDNNKPHKNYGYM